MASRQLTTTLLSRTKPALTARVTIAYQNIRHIQSSPQIRNTTSAAAITETSQPSTHLHDGIIHHEQAISPVVATGPAKSRLQRLRSSPTLPFSSFLTDSFARRHTYLRISLTERCNLRCTYCMPADGVQLSPAATQLTTPEILLLSDLFVSQGVNKIRLTGGEPTVRRDIVPLVRDLGSLRQQGLKELCITSNGVALRSKLDALVDAGLTGVNLSLDTLDPGLFEIITRRRGLEKVLASMERILQMNALGAQISLKVNVVVMRGINEREILDFVELTRDKDMEVRFIEYMPFDGNRWAQQKMVAYQEMLDLIRGRYPGLHKTTTAPATKNTSETSKTYQVPGFKGRVGFITSMTDNFCAGCNRLRITSDGNLKVCLFGNAEVSLRDLLRKENDGHPIDDGAFARIKKFALAKQNHREDGKAPMESEGVGGVESWKLSKEREEELLEVIGTALGKKKARHAGLGALENMKNRPMILIGKANVGPTIVQTWGIIPHLLNRRPFPCHISPIKSALRTRLFSSCVPLRLASGVPKKKSNEDQPRLAHLSSNSEVHMVSIGQKSVTRRSATAVAHVAFSNPKSLSLIRSNALAKGDVLSIARVAGIMAVKRTPDLIPLCHPGLTVEGVSVLVEPVGNEDPVDNLSAPEEDTIKSNTSKSMSDFFQWRLEREMARGLGRHGGIRIAATVECEGKTGVEMEALTGAIGAALTVVDMCKGVDKGLVIGDARMIRKEGGRSGTWIAEGWR